MALDKTAVSSIRCLPPDYGCWDQPIKLKLGRSRNIVLSVFAAYHNRCQADL